MENRDLTDAEYDVIYQLFLHGPTWDGDLISKAGRTSLVAVGYAEQYNGFQWLTLAGVKRAIELNMDRRKEKQLRDERYK